MPVLRKLVILGTSLCLSMAIGLALAEFAYQQIQTVRYGESWHDPNTRFDPTLGWHPVPDSRLVNGWGTVSTNSDGFRSSEVAPGVTSVLLLGDSVAWGYGVSDEDTLPSLLDSLLRGTQRQVSNLAVSGYGVGQYSLFLERHIGRFANPERVIVVIYTGNDLQETRSNVAYGKRKPLFLLEDGGLRLANRAISKYCLRNVLSKSIIARTICARFAGLASWLDAAAVDREVDEAQAKAVIVMLLNGMERLAVDRGAAFTVVLSPRRDDVTQESVEHRWFREGLRREGFEVVDLLVSMRAISEPGIDSLFLDGGHLTRAGNGALARMLCRRLWPQSGV